MCQRLRRMPGPQEALNNGPYKYHRFSLSLAERLVLTLPTRAVQLRAIIHTGPLCLSKHFPLSRAQLCTSSSRKLSVPTFPNLSKLSSLGTPTTLPISAFSRATVIDN